MTFFNHLSLKKIDKKERKTNRVRVRERESRIGELENEITI